MTEIEVGLWIRAEGQSFLIRADPQGHPDIEALSEGAALPDREAKKRQAKALYEQITGRPYPTITPPHDRFSGMF